MGKRLSFNDLPSAVERMLEILTSEESEHAALPELVRRMTVLEKKIDYLQRTLSPEMTVMDIPTVCRVLKLRPKAVKELAESGALPYRTEGRKTLFYEDGVVKYVMTQPAWSSAASKPAPPKPNAAEAISADIATGERQRVDINVASGILDRSTAAIYQLISNNRVPYHKDGKKVYFFSDELWQWVQENPPRKRLQKKEIL